MQINLMKPKRDWRPALFLLALVVIFFVWFPKPKTKKVVAPKVVAPVAPAYPERLPFNRDSTTGPVLTMDEVQKRAVQSRMCLAMGAIVDPASASRRIWNQWKLIQAAADAYDIPAEKLAGVIMLESQGRTWLRSGADAAGIGQFIPRTALGYGLKVAVDKTLVTVNGKLRVRVRTSKVTLALLAKRTRLLKLLDKKPTTELRHKLAATENAIRRRDERYVPAKAVRASAHYLAALYDTFGSWDWATASYHMGSAKAQKLLKMYVTGYLTWEGSAKATLARHDISWAQFLLDVTPSRHPATHQELHGLEDQSEDYALRVAASWQVAALWRKDREAFNRLRAIYNYRYNGKIRRWQLADELLWYPKNQKELWCWDTTKDLETAYKRGELVAIPQNLAAIQATGIHLDDMGSLVRKEYRPLYALTRPETAGGMYLLASFYRHWSTAPVAPLQINSLVRSNAYQILFVQKRMSPSVYSGHCAGLSFDIQPPVSAAERERLRFTLQHFRYLGYWAWFKEGSHYHVTISPIGRTVLKRVWQEAVDAPPPRPPV